MSFIQVTDFPFNNTPSSGAVIMVVDNNTYYQMYLSTISGNNGGGNTGNFYLVSNPNNFASSGNVQNTGTLLQNEIYGLSGQLNATGSLLFSLIQSAGVSSINSTNGTLFLSGSSNIQISQSGKTFFVSGNNTSNNSIRFVSGNFNILSTDNILFVNTTNSSSTGTFLNSSGAIGQQFIIKDYLGNCISGMITLTGVNNQTFDGNSNYIMNVNYESITVISNINNWSLI